MSLISRASTKRGDTLIEVMFAVGVFALVAIISVAVMNSGINNAERDLELVTARNELNAQAETLRFIHSSYISEMTLPTCKPSLALDEKCQQYFGLWTAIIGNAVDPTKARDSGLLNLADFNNCGAIYNTVNSNGQTPLQQVNAFILNTRKVTNSNVNGSTGNNTEAYINIKSNSAIFRPTDLSARIIYRNSSGDLSDDLLINSNNGQLFNRVEAAEGIWAFAVKGDDNLSGTPKYYDFYIQTCWYGPRANHATVLDTVIRLYNPESI